MNSLEMNKIAAAILVAGLVAMMSGFLADMLVQPDPLEQNVYQVAGLPQEEAPAAEAEAEEQLQPIVPLLAEVTAEAGQSAAGPCVACHSFEQGGPRKVGPNLYNVVGNDIAHRDDFNYSDALAQMEGTWGYEELNAFLASPQDFAPGTRMTFRGVKDTEDRAAIVKYLRSLSESPPPIPGS